MRASFGPIRNPRDDATDIGFSRLCTAGYGLCWLIGSALIGFLYDHSISAVVIFCVACQLAALPFFNRVRRQ